jgi:hypothetical protein
MKERKKKAKKLLLRVLERNAPLAYLGSRVYPLVRKEFPDAARARAQLSHRGVDLSRFRLRADMAYCRFHWGTKPKEYVLFGLYRLNDVGRREYLNYRQWVDLANTHIDKESLRLLHDKFTCYKRIARFYQREVIKLAGPEDAQKLDDFLARHRRGIVKPNRGSLGKGISIVDDAGEVRLEEISADKPLIMEEVLEQMEPLRSLHPASINTLRVVTCRVDGKTHVLYTLLRMGVGASVVDNAGAGGIVAEVDRETGIVRTVGYDETGTAFVRHPDTQCVIPGLLVPQWQELLDLVCRLAEEFPGVKVIGWDMALTEQGWVVVEVNNRPIIRAVQLIRGTGIRNELETLLGTERRGGWLRRFRMHLPPNTAFMYHGESGAMGTGHRKGVLG